jgi:hypothetical protein
MKKIVFKYGIISGFIGALTLIVPYYMDIPTRGNRFLIMIVFMALYFSSFLAIWEARKIDNNEIRFLKALKMGVSAGLIASLFFSFFTAIYYFLLNPDFASSDLKDIEIMLKQQYQGAELQQKLIAYKNEVSAWNEAFTKLKGSTITSVILAVVNALMFCKKD